MSLWIFGLVSLVIWGVVAAIFISIGGNDLESEGTSKGLKGAVGYLRDLAKTLTIASVVCLIFIWLCSLGLIPRSTVIATFEGARAIRVWFQGIGNRWSAIMIVALLTGIVASMVKASKVASILNSKGMFKVMTTPSKCFTAIASILLVPALVGRFEGGDILDRLSLSTLKAEISLDKEKLEHALVDTGEGDDFSKEEQAHIDSISRNIAVQIRTSDYGRISNDTLANAYRARVQVARWQVLKEAEVPNVSHVFLHNSLSPWEQAVYTTAQPDEPASEAVQTPVPPSSTDAEEAEGVAEKPISDAIKARAKRDPSFRAKLKDFAASFHEEQEVPERLSTLFGKIAEKQLGVSLGEEPASFLSDLSEKSGGNDRVVNFVTNERDQAEIIYQRSKARILKAAASILNGDDLHTVAPIANSGDCSAASASSKSERLTRKFWKDVVNPPMSGGPGLSGPTVQFPTDDPNRGGTGGGGGGGTGGSGGGEGPSLEPTFSGQSEAEVVERASYSHMFPANPAAMAEVPEEAAATLASEVSSVGNVARDFSMLEGVGEVGGVLIGRHADGSDQLDVRDIQLVDLPSDPNQVSVVLIDEKGVSHTSKPCSKDLVFRALSYAADGRPVTFTKPLTKDHYRIDAAHPAIAGSTLQSEMDRLDSFTDEFTAKDYAPRTDVDNFFLGESTLLSSAWTAKTLSDKDFASFIEELTPDIQKLPPDSLQTLGALMSNPALLGTDNRSFLYHRINPGSTDVPYGLDLIGNLEDIAPNVPQGASATEVAQAFTEELQKLRALYKTELQLKRSKEEAALERLLSPLKSRIENGSMTEKEAEEQVVAKGTELNKWAIDPQPRPESGVRELPFGMSFSNILPGQNTSPVLTFVLVTVFDGGRSNPDPFNFPGIAEELNQTVFQRIQNNTEAYDGKTDEDVYADASDFTILQRLFRSAFDGRLGYGFPVERLAGIESAMKTR